MSISLALVVSLPNNFIAQLDRIIDDELALAQKKWKLKLTNEEQELIRQSTRTQLRSKVSGLAKTNWDLGDKLTINASGASGSIAIDKKTKSDKKITLLLSKAGWAVTSEESDYLVEINDFYESLIKTITTWTRTAVFYGVGSYTSR